ncbi:TERF1-interacting nuclear factor 2 [Anguilla rostrata]|uniref:TERF1-interacting nuclear factor 2 n=1 Tax=Anguilla rostrata TaxID=7938 RepID=UPI0030CD5A34
MGDSILSSLSLPPSGRVRSTSQEMNSLSQSGVGPDSLSPAALTHPANRRQGSGSPIQPMNSQDLPFTPPKGRRVETAQATPIMSKEVESGVGSPHSLYTGVKLRSQASLDRGGERQEGAERKEGRGGACNEQEACFKQRRLEEEQRTGGGGENRAELRKSEHLRQERRSQREDRSGAPPSPPQEEAELSPLVISCLQRQPRVRLERLRLADIAPPALSSPRLPGSGVRSPRRPAPGAAVAASPRRGWCPGTRKRKLSSTVTPEKCLPNSSEKENSADSSLMWGTSPVLSLRTKSGGRDSLRPDCDDDIIIDSEDDEINNVKGRLFVKQYYRTKNNTFVPTLREFWGHSLA